MIGPCLCGDPYCPSCGNPSAAAHEEVIEKIADKLMEFDELELHLIDSYIDHIKNTADQRNKYINNLLADQAQGYEQQISDLKFEIDLLEEK